MLVTILGGDGNVDKFLFLQFPNKLVLRVADGFSLVTSCGPDLSQMRFGLGRENDGCSPSSSDGGDKFNK